MKRDDNSRTKRDGFGDDGGARVGRPDPAGNEKDGRSGPSSAPVSEGLEGAVFDRDEGEDEHKKGSLGSGSEASEGVHASGGRDEEDKSSTVGKEQLGAEGDRHGSEPLDRKHEHKGSYGGEGGEPRVSSDQRE